MGKWSLNAKFVAILSIFVVTAVGIAALGLNRMNELNNALNALVAVTMKRTLHIKTADALSNDIRDIEKTYILEESIDGMKKLGVELDEVEASLRKEIGSFKELATERGKEDVVELNAILDEWKPISEQIRKHSLASQNKEAFALAMGKSKGILAKFDKILNEIIERNAKFMEEESIRTDVLVENAQKMIWIGSASSILAALVIAFFTLRNLNRSMNSVIANLRDSSGQVSSAAQQIAASSEQLSAATSEQAASLEETATALEEVQSMIQKNSENSRTASGTADTSRDSAVRGKKTVEDMIRAITTIEQSNGAIIAQVEAGNQQLAEIVKVIAEIGTKTKVINDIVFQTKLLSFNASVEAARAGEQGKGFAVVAEEVGNLAQMSGNAAKEISEMLDESIRKVETIVTDSKAKVTGLIATGTASIEAGTRIARDCGDALEEIVQQITSVSGSAAEISTASTEQAQGITEINKAMGQLDQVTQQNSSASRETASAAEELSAQAESLTNVVQTLVAAVKGEHAAGVRPSVGEAARTVRRATAKAPSAPNPKVVSLEPRLAKETAKRASPTPESLKKAAGFDGVPQSEDPRFQDV